MIDAATRHVLLELIREENRSLLRYISEADPRVTPEEEPALRQVLEMVNEQQAAVGQIVAHLQKHRVSVPPLGTYPHSFTTMNFISLDYLLPVLVDHGKQRIAQIEAHLPQVSDTRSRVLVQQILDLKRRHVQAIESMLQTVSAA
jgi:hypothetical protein